jgi:hypothetical protein
MSIVWCASCGAYVGHDPGDAHAVRLDVPMGASPARPLQPWFSGLTGLAETILASVKGSFTRRSRQLPSGSLGAHSHEVYQ